MSYPRRHTSQGRGYHPRPGRLQTKQAVRLPASRTPGTTSPSLCLAAAFPLDYTNTHVHQGPRRCPRGCLGADYS
ncbi:hypothetical protein Naga_102238g1 [Nannochloropsis gaditana]|uniref:Uncharacterized protein n=1 Tax=Nannochloropsis gaditana TaxID=72520 RepID=W7T1C2_9STRA|nr:hypothetical protein Naga_102238g1 [Nannochloropsis gaditana]